MIADATLRVCGELEAVTIGLTRTIPKVSVIVPTCDRPEYLAEALGSIAAQTEPSFECIVVDDGSRAPAALPFDDPRFRLIRHHTNLGVAAARNTGLRTAIGEYVAFLDDDDLWAPARLDHALRHAAPGVVVVCSCGRVGSNRVDAPVLRPPLAQTILETSTPNLGAVLVPLRSCPDFDSRFAACEDLDWWLRLAPSVRPVVTTDAGWLWREHDGPRGRVGTQARIDGSLRLMAQHSQYFSDRPAAAAYRWARIGWLARAVGNRRLMCSAAARAVRLHPRPRTLARSVRVVVGR